MHVHVHVNDHLPITPLSHKDQATIHQPSQMAGMQKQELTRAALGQDNVTTATQGLPSLQKHTFRDRDSQASSHTVQLYNIPKSKRQSTCPLTPSLSLVVILVHCPAQTGRNPNRIPLPCSPPPVLQGYHCKGTRSQGKGRGGGLLTNGRWLHVWGHELVEMLPNLTSLGNSSGLSVA